MSEFAPGVLKSPAELAARDRLVCGCENPDHGHTVPCGAKAVAIVTQHSFDDCTGPHPRLDEDGNVTVPICRGCLDDARIACGAWLVQIRRWRPYCMTCHAPMVAMSDVLRRIVPL